MMMSTHESRMHDLTGLVRKQLRSQSELDELATALRSFQFFKEHNITKQHELTDIASAIRYEQADKH